MPSFVTVGWRSVVTQYGDSLQDVAFRHLGDAARWPEIAWLNDLRPPYLTGDKLRASAQVILYGAPIKIPSVSGSASPGVTLIEAFGSDVRLLNGHLEADDLGNLVLATGVANLSQALNHRIMNDFGCLKFHPKYGNLAHRLRGRKVDSNIGLLALRFCEETVLADPRVKSVFEGAARVSGDAILVSLTAMADSGLTLRLQVEI